MGTVLLLLEGAHPFFLLLLQKLLLAVADDSAWGLRDDCIGELVNITAEAAIVLDEHLLAPHS